MEREEYINWCSNCSLRKSSSDIGLVCSLTDRQADFDKDCTSFKIDVNAFVDNERTNIKFNYPQVWEGKIDEPMPTRKISWKRYSTPQDLPRQFVIRNSELLFEKIAVTLIGIFMIGMAYYNAKLGGFDELANRKLAIGIFVALMVLFFGIGSRIMKSRNQNPQLTIDEEGLTFGDGTKFNWDRSVTMMVTLTESIGSHYLVVNSVGKEPRVGQLSGLNLGARKIGHLIELYKEKRNTSPNIH